MIETVDRACDALLSPGHLTPAGPELLKGTVVLSFFERIRSKALFGILKNEEKRVWEQWTLPILISTTPRPLGDDDPSRLERSRADADADRLLRARIGDVHRLVNGPLDHVPDSIYEFEIFAGGDPSADRKPRRIIAPPVLDSIARSF